MERVAQDGSEKAAKTAGGTGSGVSGAAESRIGGHYATTVTGANYHADGRREEYIFHTASSEHEDWGDDGHYTAEFTARGLER